MDKNLQIKLNTPFSEIKVKCFSLIQLFSLPQNKDPLRDTVFKGLIKEEGHWKPKPTISFQYKKADH